jgi:hypothetical protein
MSDATITRSIELDRDGIRLRAGRHMERVFRTLTAGKGGESKDDYFRWITREAHPLGNVVFQSAESDAASAREAVEPLLAEDLPSAVLFPTGVSVDAANSLIAAGFSDSPAIPAMAVDIERLPPTKLPDGYSFTRVTSGRQGEAWADTLAAGYGLPVGLARRLSPAVIGADMSGDSRTQFFAVVHDERIVATSMLFLDDGLAGIYSVATLQDERGKGIGGYATAQPLRVAHTLGYRVGVLQSSQAGHSVYLGLGFIDVGEVPMFTRTPTH